MKIYWFLLGIFESKRSLTTAVRGERQRGAYDAGRAFAQRFEKARLA